MTISIDSILLKFADDDPTCSSWTVDNLIGEVEQELIDLGQDRDLLYDELTEDHGPYLEILSLAEFQFLCKHFSLYS